MFKNLIYGVLRWRFYTSLTDMNGVEEALGFKFKYFKGEFLCSMFNFHRRDALFYWVEFAFYLYWYWINIRQTKKLDSMLDAQYKIHCVLDAGCWRLENQYIYIDATIRYNYTMLVVTRL